MNKYQDALNLLKSWAKKDRNAYSPKHLKKYKRLCKYITGGSRKAIPKKNIV